MARSDDKFLVRDSSDVELEGDVYGIELNDEHGRVHRYGIAGADGRAEAERVSNEAERVSNEAERVSAEKARIANEAKRVSAESERAAKDTSRDAATSAANSAASAANSAAQSANANAATAHEQANAAKSAAEQANAAARLAKPYFIQGSEPPYADRVDGCAWMQTDGSRIANINRWDASLQGAALFPQASTYPQSTTYPAPRGAWSKFSV